MQKVTQFSIGKLLPNVLQSPGRNWGGGGAIGQKQAGALISPPWNGCRFLWYPKHLTRVQGGTVSISNTKREHHYPTPALRQDAGPHHIAGTSGRHTVKLIISPTSPGKVIFVTHCCNELQKGYTNQNLSFAHIYLGGGGY